MFKTAKKCQQYKQEALGQHTRSKQPKKMLIKLHVA
jgi:hypothetical protein